MRHSLDPRSFASGIVAALSAVGVTFLTIGAARRVRAIRAASRKMTAETHFIDGARPISPVLLDALPQEEGNAASRRLASEAVDAPPQSQRW